MQQRPAVSHIQDGYLIFKVAATPLSASSNFYHTSLHQPFAKSARMRSNPRQKLFMTEVSLSGPHTSKLSSNYVCIYLVYMYVFPYIKVQPLI